MPYFLLPGKDPEGSVSKGDHQRPSSGKLWSWQVEPLAIRRKLGDGTTPSSDVYFGDGSLLVVDVSELKEKAAITGASSEGGPSQTAVITSESRLHIINAVKDDDLTVLASFSSITNGTTAGEIGWAGIDVNPDRMLITEVEVREDSASNYSVVAHSTVETASKVLPCLDEEFNPAMSHVRNNSLNDLNSPDMGIRFLSRAANSDYIPDARKATATIESATHIAFAGAVPQMTKMASDSATNSVVNRMGFANPENGAKAMNLDGKLVDDMALGLALWIAPLWSNQTGFDMEAGNLDYGYNTNLGDISLGADYTWPTTSVPASCSTSVAAMPKALVAI